MDKIYSTRTFILLIIVYVLVATISIFLPQDSSGQIVSAGQLPVPLPVFVLINIGLLLVIYGGLGFLGLTLSRKIELPEICASTITNRQRFLIPALIGFGCAIVIIIGDQIFASFNGVGHIPHPPFPTSITASIAAGIGEEIIFRLFFISFWTWLVSRVILRGRWQSQTYWFFSLVSAVIFGISHLPVFMVLYGWTSISQAPSMLIMEMVLLNGIVGFFAAWYFKKYGFLAPVGIHFWADILWHVIWGLV